MKPGCSQCIGRRGCICYDDENEALYILEFIKAMKQKGMSSTAKT